MKIKRFSKKEDDEKLLKEIDEKLARLDEKEREAKINELKNQEALYKAGIGTGIAGGLSGAVMMGLSKVKPNPRAKGLKINLTPEDAKRLNNLGKGAAILGTGAAIAGTAGTVVKRRKIKKLKNDNTEKK